MDSRSHNRIKFECNTLKYTLRNSGFTLLEVLVAVAILASLLSLGFLFDVNSIARSSFSSEQSLLVHLLSRARSKSVSHIDGVSHGLCHNNANHSYTLFEGLYLANNPSNIIVLGSSIAEVRSTAQTLDCNSGGGVIFTELSGTTSPIDIVMRYNNTVSTTSINYEGTILW